MEVSFHLRYLGEELGKADQRDIQEHCHLNPSEVGLDEVVTLIKSFLEPDEEGRSSIETEKTAVEAALKNFLDCISQSEFQLFFGCLRSHLDCMQFAGIHPVVNGETKRERTLKEFFKCYGLDSLATIAKIAYHSIKGSAPKDVLEVVRLLEERGRGKKVQGHVIPLSVFKAYMQADILKVFLPFVFAFHFI